MVQSPRPLHKGARCRDTDQASAALVKDLKQRGMIDDTLVVWGGKFGRSPVIQGKIGSPQSLSSGS